MICHGEWSSKRPRRLYILNRMSRIQLRLFYSPGWKYFCLTLSFCLLVFMGHFTDGLAFSRPVGSDTEALQSCPAVQEEIVDLQILAEGLKQTRAVGFFEKIKLKSAIDDLVGRFEAYHQGSQKFTIVELQQQYDVLLMRIATHLQHQDVILHQQLCNAWELIWEDLSDAGRFSEKFS